MKRYVYSAKTDIAKLASGEKAIRDKIYNIWTSSPDGEWFHSYSDPRLVCNLVKKEFLADTYNKSSYSTYVFDMRDDIFEDKIIAFVDESNYPDFVKDHMLEYYYSLDPSDYNRMLYLKRDEKELNRLRR